MNAFKSNLDVPRHSTEKRQPQVFKERGKWIDDVEECVNRIFKLLCSDPLQLQRPGSEAFEIVDSCLFDAKCHHEHSIKCLPGMFDTMLQTFVSSIPLRNVATSSSMWSDHCSTRGRMTEYVWAKCLAFLACLYICITSAA